MRVKALRDHFDSTHTYRHQGDEFDYEGKLHEHIKPVQQAAPIDAEPPAGDDSEQNEVTAIAAKAGKAKK